MTTLRNKRVLITGAAHGLGRELAKGFGLSGCEVIVTDLDATRVNEAVTSLRKADISAFGYLMDVTSSASVLSAQDLIHAEHGPVDILINNAGIVSGGTFENVPLERHKAIYDVNCFGPVTVTHAFLPELIARSESHIVNVASAAAFLPLPFAATYASSKWALFGFSESLREELRLTGQEHVRITSVCPSYISTGMFTGVKPPLLMPMLTVNDLTDEVVSAVRLNREIVRTPWPVRLLPLLQGLFPRCMQRWFGDRLGVFQSMQTWRDLNSPTRLAKEAAPAKTTDSRSVSLSR